MNNEMETLYEIKKLLHTSYLKENKLCEKISNEQGTCKHCPFDNKLITVGNEKIKICTLLGIIDFQFN